MYIKKDLTSTGVSVITATNKPDYINNIFTNYRRQSYKNKELIIILNNNSMDIEQLKEKTQSKDIKLFQLDESKFLGDCLNYGVGKSKYPLIAKFDDDDYYSPRYLEEAVNAFGSSGADIVGKQKIYIYLEDTNLIVMTGSRTENGFVEKMVAGGTIIFKQKVFDKVQFKELKTGTDQRFLKNCYNSNYRIYSSSRNNYLYIRHYSKGNHTWKVKDREFLEKCIVLTKAVNYMIYEKDGTFMIPDRKKHLF